MEYNGVFFGWAETGTEGTYYALQEYKHIISPTEWSYEGLKVIEPGDYIVINNEEGKEVFKGFMEAIFEVPEDRPLMDDSDFFAGYMKYPKNPRLGQLIINNFWVHWLPKGVDLRLWYDIFFKNSDTYTGKIIKSDG